MKKIKETGVNVADAGVKAQKRVSRRSTFTDLFRVFCALAFFVLALLACERAVSLVPFVGSNLEWCERHFNCSQSEEGIGTRWIDRVPAVSRSRGKFWQTSREFLKKNSGRLKRHFLVEKNDPTEKTEETVPQFDEINPKERTNHGGELAVDDSTHSATGV